MVSRKLEKGTCFRELSSKANMGLPVQFMKKKPTCRRPDLMIQEKQTKTIQICDMACPQENNIEKKRMEKRTNYRQLAFKIKERRPGFKVKVVPLVISAFDGGLKEI